MSDTANFDDLRHPDYVRMARRWQMALDFWRGGLSVMSPDYEVAQARFAVPQTTTSDTSAVDIVPGRAEQEYTWYSSPNHSYLHKHDRETLEEFHERQIRQSHLPLFQYVVNIYSSGILRSGPEDKPTTGWWREYYDDVDGAGTSMDAFRHEKLALALTFGRIHVITDRAAGQPAVNRLQQQLAGDRAWSYLLTPLDLVDWCLDERGRFVWVIVRESAPDLRSPGEAYGEIGCQYRVWTQADWTLYRQVTSDDGKAWAVAGSGKHGAGEVPISTMWACRVGRTKSMACESPLCDVLDFDRSFLNDLSEANEIDRAQAFAFLAWPEVEGSPIGTIEVGPWRGASYPAQAGPPTYVAPPYEIADSRWRRAQEKLFVVRQLAGASRGKAEYSKEERSAAALDVEAEDKRNQMAWWASEMEESDRHQLRLVSLVQGVDGQPEPRYPRRFDVASVTQQISDLVQISAVAAVPVAAAAEMARPIVERILREAGAGPESIDAALAAIELEATKPEPEPMAPALPAADQQSPDDASVA